MMRFMGKPFDGWQFKQKVLTVNAGISYKHGKYGLIDKI